MTQMKDTWLQYFNSTVYCVLYTQYIAGDQVVLLFISLYIYLGISGWQGDAVLLADVYMNDYTAQQGGNG